jgi:CBS domain-containing protein
MKAADVMVTKVITVTPDVLVQDVAYILLSNRISAVPVVDDNGQLLGIVSEGDLMRRAEAGTGRHRSWWLATLAGRDMRATDYVKEHSRKVTDVMTRDVVTATPETPLQEIATLLENNGIKRVPIVEYGKMIGIVSRANLLQALASMRQPHDVDADDAVIREGLVARLEAAPWTHPTLINVIVQDGTADLWGIVDSQAEKKAVCVVAEITPGVRAVNDHLIIRPMVSGI